MQYELCLLLNLKPSASLLASEQVFNKNLLQTHENFLHLAVKSCQNVFPNHFPTNESLTFIPTPENHQHLVTVQKNGNIASLRSHILQSLVRKTLNGTQRRS
jgi:hypothetical protein